jgi:hypothetical protein
MLSISSCVFLAIRTSWFEKGLFSSFAHFFIESLIFQHTGNLIKGMGSKIAGRINHRTLG